MKNMNYKVLKTLDIPREVISYLNSIGLPPELLDVWYIFEMGALKHGRDTYLEPTNKSLQPEANYSSICRHAAKSAYECPLDSESGQHHDLHIATRAIMRYVRTKRNILDKS